MNDLFPGSQGNNCLNSCYCLLFLSFKLLVNYPQGNKGAC